MADDTIQRELRRLRDAQYNAALLANPSVFMTGGELVQAVSLGPSTNLSTVTAAVLAIRNTDKKPMVVVIRADGPNGGQSIGLFVARSPDECTVPKALISRYGSSPEIALVVKSSQKLYMGVISNSAVVVRVVKIPLQAASILDVEADIDTDCR